MLSEYFSSLVHLSITTHHRHQDLSITTHHRHQAIIQALFNFAVEQGYLTVNPIAGLKRRKSDPVQGEYDTDQVVRYLGQIDRQSMPITRDRTN